MTNMNEVVTSPAISSMLLGNRTTLFQTTPSRRSNWAVVAFCSCSLFFRFAVKSLLNVFSLVFGFLGGGVKVSLNFKQAPLAFCATWWRFLEQWLWEQLSQCCEVMHSWMLWNCCRAALNQRALVSSDSLLTPCSSALPSLLHLCYWNENGGSLSDPVWATSCGSQGLLLILGSTTPVLGKLAKIRCNSKPAANCVKL